MGGSYVLFQDKDLHPFLHNVFIILPNESHCHLFVFCRQRFDTLFVTYMNIHEFTVLDDEVKYAFAVGVAYMHMYRLMFP